MSFPSPLFSDLVPKEYAYHQAINLQNTVLLYAFSENQVFYLQNRLFYPNASLDQSDSISTPNP